MSIRYLDRTFRKACCVFPQDAAHKHECTVPNKVLKVPRIALLWDAVLIVQ